MFLFKGIRYWNNLTSTSCNIKLINNSFVQKFCSETTPSTKTATLDRLYKKVAVEVRGNDPAVLKSYGIFATTAAAHLGITVGRNTTPRKHNVERFTILKSAFVHKKHRVQYEIRTYYRHIDFLRITGSTADTLLEYLQRNLPEGVAMKVTKHEITAMLESIRPPHQQIEQ